MITTIKKIKPLFNMVITTCNKYDKEQKIIGTDLIDTTKADTVKEYQTVVAVGPNVRGVEPGDVVYINPKRYAVMKHKEGSLKDGIITDNSVLGYNFELVEVDGEQCLVLFDNDLKFVAEIEEFEEKPSVVTNDQINPIILN